MKGKIIATLMTLLLVIGITPVLAVDVGTGVGIDIETEDFAPKVYVDANTRVVTDDTVPTGRNTVGGALTQRTNNYGFEGEMLSWNVLVYDRNGIETVLSPTVTAGTTHGVGKDVE